MSPPPRDAGNKSFWIRGGNFKDNVDEHCRRICEHLGVSAVMPEGRISTPEFCLMIAKVAHAFAVAQLGLGAFRPLLPGIIMTGNPENRAEYLGGLPNTVSPAEDLHEASFMFAVRRDVIGVYVRLLSCLGTP
jgi:hypothetical protein